MQITKIRLKNWRNFQKAEAEKLADVCYILGPNASGKSNLLDVFRFLRDIAKPKGGGLQIALDTRGSLKKLRCLHARGDTDVMIEIELASEYEVPTWRYSLIFNMPSRGKRITTVKKESVIKIERDGTETTVLQRPNNDDKKDPERLYETHLEQISANSKFRNLAEFFGSITYVHLVPQLLKFGDRIGGHILEEDPFGQAFMERIAATQNKTRTARLKRIEKALQAVIPHLEDLQFIKDEISGRPHLEIRYKHHRPHGAKQREDQFSDGTLRLISILWLLQEGGDSPLLLEEPELSLNEQIVENIPRLVDEVRRKLKNKRQLFISTHSEALLSNPGIDPTGIMVIVPSVEGSTLRGVNSDELSAMASGFSPADVVLPNARRVSDKSQIEFSL